MQHDFKCEDPRCGFVSLGHPTEESRDARALQHMTEHETGEPMPELKHFLDDTVEPVSDDAEQEEAR